MTSSITCLSPIFATCPFSRTGSSPLTQLRVHTTFFSCLLRQTLCRNRRLPSSRLAGLVEDMGNLKRMRRGNGRGRLGRSDKRGEWEGMKEKFHRRKQMCRLPHFKLLPILSLYIDRDSNVNIHAFCGSCGYSSIHVTVVFFGQISGYARMQI